jgi:IS5 family transposase
VNGKASIFLKNLSPTDATIMYRHNLKQLEFVEFSLPFDGTLSSDNKWVKLAALIPWEQFEGLYRKNFSDRGVGNPALSVRMALAALIIKEELRASDRACVEQITENPYLQYFCGLKAFITEPPFDPSMLVHFRKRFPKDVLAKVNNAVAQKVREKKDPPKDPDGPSASQNSSNKGKGDNEQPANKGKLLVMPPAPLQTSRIRRILSCSTKHVRKANKSSTIFIGRVARGIKSRGLIVNVPESSFYR